MKRYDVLVAGEVNPDLILSDPHLAVGFGQQETVVDNFALTIGSSSAIFACGAARLGLKVGFVGVVGDDLFGHFMLDAMRARDVDVTPIIIDPMVKTGLSVILSRGGDRAILTYPGAIAVLHAEQVSNDLLSQARHLHIASFFLQTRLQPDLPDLFRRAHSLGLTNSLDTNWDPSGRWDGFDALMRAVDVFLPNENEVLAITQMETTALALERLSRLSGIVAIKQGASGAVAQCGGETRHCDAVQIRVADTVGAGDTFDAGFIYGFLNGWPLARSLHLACVCGSLSAQAVGGTDGQPTLDQAMQQMGLA